MSVFLVGLAGLIALGLVFVLPPLLRATRLPTADIAEDAARRANLIAKGLIFAPEHGRIAYTVPGMADFIRRQKRN